MYEFWLYISSLHVNRGRGVGGVVCTEHVCENLQSVAEVPSDFSSWFNIPGQAWIACSVRGEGVQCLASLSKLQGNFLIEPFLILANFLYDFCESFWWMLIALLLPQNLQILCRQKLMMFGGKEESKTEKRCVV